MAWAVISALLRSNGRVPQPRQNVGMPPSRFCAANNQPMPWNTCGSEAVSTPRFFKASNAPAVSSASGTPPGKSVQAHPPGAAWVYGCRARYCCWSSHCRIFSLAGADRALRAGNALTASVVSQVARLVSIGQLPSARCEASKKSTPFSTTGCAICPEPARLSTTKLVSGVASRKPPFSGCNPFNLAKVRGVAWPRKKRDRGLALGAW